MTKLLRITNYCIFSGVLYHSRMIIMIFFIPSIAFSQCVNRINTVTNTSDSVTVVGSLRWAVDSTNKCAGHGTIDFDIPGTGPYRITLSAPITIASSVTIDGYTQPGSVENTAPIFEGTNSILNIEIRGSGEVPTAFYLVCSETSSIGANGTVLRGLVINNFDSVSIYNIKCNDTKIVGNYIGVNTTASSIVNPPSFGVTILDSSNNKVGSSSPADRNHIVADFAGVYLVSTSADPESLAIGNIIENNFIGTNRSGLESIVQGIQTGLNGIIISGQGTTPQSSSDPVNLIHTNLISGHINNGIWLFDSNKTRITSNIIGSNISAFAAISALFNGTVVPPVIEVLGMGNLTAGIRIGSSDGRLKDVPTDDLVSNNNVIDYNAINHNGYGIWNDTGIDNNINYNSISGNQLTGIYSIPQPCGVISPPAGCTTSYGDWDKNSISNNGNMDIDTDDPGPELPLLSMYSIIDNVYTVKNALIGIQCEIQFFANQNCDSTGQGESYYYIGNIKSASCPEVVTFSPPQLPLPGNHVVAILRLFNTSGMSDISIASESSECISNIPPIVSLPLPDKIVTEDIGINYSIPVGSFSDPNNDNLTYNATLSDFSALPSWLIFEPTNQVFSGVPTNSDVGIVNITVSAVDTSGPSTVTDNFQLTVINTNDTPLAVSDTSTTLLNTSVTVDVLINDQDDDLIHGDALSIANVEQPLFGSATIINQMITYNPNVDYTGTDSFTYTVQDLTGETDITTVNILVLSETVFNNSFED